MSLTSPVNTYLHAGTGLCSSFNKILKTKKAGEAISGHFVGAILL